MEHVCEIHNKPEYYVINPYVDEIYGREEFEWMCKECYHEACMDI